MRLVIRVPRDWHLVDRSGKRHPVVVLPPITRPSKKGEK